MAPSIFSHKSRPTRTQFSISGPIEGSFVDFSQATSENTNCPRAPPNLQAFPSLPAASPNKVASTTPSRRRRSPSISTPLKGTFRHVSHVGAPERFTAPDDTTPSSPPTRPRRISDPKHSLHRDRDAVIAGGKVTPLSNTDPRSSVHQSQRPTHGLDDTKFGRTTSRHADEGRRRTRGSPERKRRSVSAHAPSRLPYHPPWAALDPLGAHAQEYSRLYALRAVQSDPDHESAKRSEGHRALSTPGPNFSHIVPREPLEPSGEKADQLASPRGRRVVRRKAVPNLDLAGGERRSVSTDAVRRRVNNGSKQVQPRPTARYFDDQAEEEPSSSRSTEEGKRAQETVWQATESTRRGPHIPSSPDSSAPFRPTTNIAPSLTVGLDARDRVMRSINAALELHDTSTLALLQDDDAQLAVDTVWDMLSVPSSTRLSTPRSPVPQRVKRARLRRLAIKLVGQYDKLPAALFLSGVQSLSQEPSARSKSADVFCGTFGNVKVALKCLHIFQSSSGIVSSKSARMFYRESLLWQDLSHPHILPFLGVSEGLLGHSVCVLSPWMKHGSILCHKEKLKDCGKLTHHNLEAVIVQWCHEIALGLAYLHDEGIVHGDLRSANILIDDTGSARLTDFGLSVALTCEDEGCGLPTAKRWLAPELLDPDQFKAESARPTSASDVYSFALTAIELYTGDVPFDMFSDTQAILIVVSGQRPSRPSLTEGVIMSDLLWELITMCWKQGPAERLSAVQAAQVLKTGRRQKLL